ncbi:hypothetical protein [Bacillus sp. EB600]|uniref:hypothetical protein n=1 Tax=Bacillus sp. EB600 TaxID=2806345 RepID=UPI00210A771E|nr:hypothetical protein [Bacillus sp. EB600]MCQ6282334.1 hypothetical protein [Bacillus sp. EB600]
MTSGSYQFLLPVCLPISTNGYFKFKNSRFNVVKLENIFERSHQYTLRTYYSRNGYWWLSGGKILPSATNISVCPQFLGNREAGEVVIIPAGNPII